MDIQQTPLRIRLVLASQQYGGYQQARLSTEYGNKDFVGFVEKDFRV
jgi:hypothetical protein